MRKKKGAMATASNKTTGSPKNSVSKSPSKGSAPLSPKLSSPTKCITPSPVILSKESVSPTPNGTAKDHLPLHNGKAEDEDKPKAPSTPKTPQTPRTPRPAEPGPSGLNRPPVGPSADGRVPSAASSITIFSPADPLGLKDRGKVTVGEIVQQIEIKSGALLRRDDFTKADVWPDLSFLAQQSRYNSDMHVKRKLYMRMVDNGLLNIFLKVFRSIHGIDFLNMLQAAQEENADNVSEASCIMNDTGKDKDSISFIDDKDCEDDRSIGVPEDIRDKRGKIAAAERYRNMPDFMKNFRAAITLLWNVSEKSPALCEECIKKGMIQLLLTDLTDPRLGVNDLKDPNKLHLVKGYLGILSNLVRFHGEARDIFRDSGAVKILQHYLKSSLLVIKSKTVMLLSYIINESENDIINSSDKHIAFFVKVLQTAVESENHYTKKYGYWAVEVIAGLNRLAAFESNKERIVQKGVLPIYSHFLKVGTSDEEQILACQGLWVLAFNPNNRNAILAEPGCVQGLENLEKNGPREETRRTSRGALWVIQQRTSSYEKDQTTKETKNQKDTARESKDLKDVPPSPVPGGRRGESESPPYQGHVMISYQWSTRLVMSKVRDRLRAAGYKVWMDTDNIALPSLEAMALAVERAMVVLACLSQKYKDSPVCRTEAEYAIRLRKEIIPLKLQPRYHADGWLGKLVGSKLAFDFTNEDNIDNMMPNLVRELGARGRVRGSSDTSSVEAMRFLSSPSLTSLNASVPLDPYNQRAMRLVAAPSLSSINTAIHVDATMRIGTWGVEDVAKWLQDNDLGSLSDKFSHVNGELLVEVRKMQQRAPETFYAMIKAELNLDFIATLKFTRALDKLT